ncbi:MAG: hypothetical protein ACW99U_17445 [Candidatus Thorarchaeota archaeon]
MCLFANAFVEGKEFESLIIPEGPEGLFAGPKGEVHKDFSKQFSDREGVFLTFDDGHCLCQFKDWSNLIAFADRIKRANGLNSLPVMVFFTSSEYPEVSSVEFDPELDTINEKPEEGVILNIGIGVRKRLLAFAGKRIKIIFKSGAKTYGIIEEYNESIDYGVIRTGDGVVHISSQEIRTIEVVGENGD